MILNIIIFEADLDIWQIEVYRQMFHNISEVRSFNSFKVNEPFQRLLNTSVYPIYANHNVLRLLGEYSID